MATHQGWSETKPLMTYGGKMQGVIIGVGNNNNHNNPHVQRQIASPPPAVAAANAAAVAAIPGQIGTVAAAGMSTPAVADSIINRKADPAQGLYQTCLALRERLRDVPDFEKFLAPPEDADPREPEDPVTQLWRCFRLGSSLCVLYNATRPVSPIPDNRCQPQLKTMNDCKAATFHFITGIKTELGIDGDDAFMISHLYSDDTNGFVKVIKTVTRILDILRERKLLLNRKTSNLSDDNAEKRPLDTRARIIDELVQTERKYVQDLENLQEYKRLLEKEEIVTKDLIHNLFMNLDALVDFQRRFLIRVETQNELPPDMQNWGSLFMQYELAFSVYEPYAANFEAAQALATQVRDTLGKLPHPVFDNFAAFLIKPVQRITKYPLLLKDLVKHTDIVTQEDQDLLGGVAAIQRIADQTNEAIRKSENAVVVKNLEGRVEDWKGHKLEQFGDLLLHGNFSVIKGDQKGDAEREYYIYLFERILLCCKEIGAGKKQSKMTVGKAKPPAISGPKGGNTKLQLKGRIFMQNVTDVISLARNGSYTLQIFWKGDPGVENFMIKHINEENLTHWKKTLQKQTAEYQKSNDRSGRTGSGSAGSVNFMWMASQDQESTEKIDRVRYQGDSESDDEEHYGSTMSGSFTMSNRSESSTSLRQRSGTNESLPPAQAYTRPAQQAPPARYPPQGITPPLTLNTNPALYNSTHSPGVQDSYFSPVETPLMSSRASSSSSQQYPFPRAYPPSVNGYHGDDPNRYTPPNMSRSSSREGSSIGQQQYQAYQQARQPSNMQRPSLPGMANNAAAAAAAHNRMRSASSPNIHHVPNPSNIARGSPGGTIPPMPALPHNYSTSTTPNSYIPYSPSVNRGDNTSPTSPNPVLPPGLRTASPTVASSAASIISQQKSQVKVLIHYNNDKLAIVVPYNIAYSQLMDRIERKVRICGSGPEIGASTPIRIKYQDEDGELISVLSDEDVQMAFDVSCDAQGGATSPQPQQEGGTCGAVTLYVQVG